MKQSVQKGLKIRQKYGAEAARRRHMTGGQSRYSCYALLDASRQKVGTYRFKKIYLCAELFLKGPENVENEGGGGEV